MKSKTNTGNEPETGVIAKPTTNEGEKSPTVLRKLIRKHMSERQPTLDKLAQDGREELRDLQIQLADKTATAFLANHGDLCITLPRLLPVSPEVMCELLPGMYVTAGNKPGQVAISIPGARLTISCGNSLQIQYEGKELHLSAYSSREAATRKRVAS